MKFVNIIGSVGLAGVTVLTVLGLSLIVSGVGRKNNTPVKTVVTQTVATSNKTAPVAVSLNKEIYNIEIPMEQVVPLIGEIGENALAIAQEITQKANNRRGLPVFLLISSPGGSVMDGAFIINAIEAAPVPVYTVCMDLCASMAAIIHQYGFERLMADRSILMFHDAAGAFQGYFPHINAQFSTVNRYIGRFNAHIAARAGIPADELDRAEHTQMWVDAEDSMAKHFADRLVYIQVRQNNKSADMKALLRPTGAKPKANTEPKFFEIYWITK